MRIVAYDDNGKATDVTEGVQICYDMVRNSMEWGSGLFDSQEIANIINLAEAAGFPDYETAVLELWKTKHQHALYMAGTYTSDEHDRLPTDGELVSLKEEIRAQGIDSRHEEAPGFKVGDRVRVRTPLNQISVLGTVRAVGDPDYSGEPRAYLVEWSDQIDTGVFWTRNVEEA